MKTMCRDLAAEYDALDAVVSKLDDRQWQTITPFYDWTIEDEITHIAFYDERGRLAASDPDAFVRHLKEPLPEPDAWNEKILTPKLEQTTAELMDFWRRERKAMLAALAAKQPGDRLPWYGPAMSARSFVTARMMETWAHGQDVYDALGRRRPETDRLRHIAHIGVVTFGWSFANRKLDVPKVPIRVELEGPAGGEPWTWGPEDAMETVRGSALGFCLVVTQRRNVADTDMVTAGSIAEKWMRIAQAFAGPAEDGPAPGQRT